MHPSIFGEQSRSNQNARKQTFGEHQEEVAGSIKGKRSYGRGQSRFVNSNTRLRQLRHSSGASNESSASALHWSISSEVWEGPPLRYYGRGRRKMTETDLLETLKASKKRAGFSAPPDKSCKAGSNRTKVQDLNRSSQVQDADQS